MPRNDLIEGFRLGNEIGNSFQQAMMQRELLKERKRQRALEEAMLRYKNPGMYIAPEERPISEAEYGELKGEKIPTAGLTNYMATDDIRDLGGGAYMNQTQADAFDSKMEERKRQQRKNAISDELSIKEEFANEKAAADFDRAMRLKVFEQDLALERGDAASANALERELQLLQRRKELGVYDRTPKVDKPVLSEIEYEAEDGSKIREKIPSDKLDEIITKKKSAKEIARLEELELKGNPNKPWFGRNTGRTDQEEVEYQALMKRYGKESQSNTPKYRSLDEIYK